LFVLQDDTSLSSAGCLEAIETDDYYCSSCYISSGSSAFRDPATRYRYKDRTAEDL